MKKMNKMMLVMVAFCAIAMPIQAQSFLEQALGSVLKGASAAIEITTLEKVVNTPSMQSQEMKNFLACYRQGDSEESTGNYYDAAQSYAKAWQIGSSCSDIYLKKLWANYGWAQDVRNKVINTCAKAGLGNPFEVSQSPSYSGGTYSSGGSSSSSSTSRTCSLCHGTGLKIKEHYSAGQTKYCDICRREVGTGHMHVTCDLCHGTGRLSY